MSKVDRQNKVWPRTIHSWWSQIVYVWSI